MAFEVRSAPGALSLRERLALAAVALAALGIRLASWSATAVGDGFVFGQPDAYYHLRRVGIILRTFPGIPGLDRFLSWPHGAECPWPPLYDLLTAAIAWAAGAGHPQAHHVGAVHALLPPVLAALTVVPVFLFARRLWGGPAGWAAAVMMVALPYHLNYSMAGAGDHHTAEAFLLALFLLLSLRALDVDAPGGPFRKAAPAGVALGAAVLVWQGAIVFSALFAGGVLSWWLVRAARPAGEGGADDVPATLRNAAVVLAVAAAVTAAGRLAWPSATEQTRFDFGFFSWFHPAFMTVEAAVLGAAFAIRRRASTAPSRAVLVAAACAAGILAAALAVPAFRENLLSGFRFVGTQDPWLASINEFKPTFGPDLFSRDLSFPLLLDLLYLAAFLVPMALSARLLAGGLRGGGFPPGVALFCVQALLIGLLGLRQRRWDNAHAVAIALGTGLLFAMLCDRFGRRFRGSAAALAASALACLPLALPSVFLAAGFVSDPVASNGLVTDPSLRWLKENTPPAAPDPFDASRQPAYAVFCDWSKGHHVMSVAERPTIVNNFGIQLRGGGIDDMVRLYLAADEAAFTEVCDRRGIRYLYLTDIAPFIRPLSKIAGVDFDAKFMRTGRGPDGRTVSYVGPEYAALAFNRLFMWNGGDSPVASAMPRFRLLYVSPGPNPVFTGGDKPVKIFEYVRGARIAGRTVPGDRVRLSCRLVSDDGRVSIAWSGSTDADARGDYVAIFPYATGGPRPGGIGPAGPVTVTTASGSFGVEVSEADVLQGGTVHAGSARR